MEADQALKLSADLAAQREAAAQPQPLTIREAIDYAAWLERTPDGVTTPEALKRAVAALHAALQVSPAYYKALQFGEGVFVLRQSDRAAPQAMVLWAELADIHGCRPEKVNEAYQLASRWREQPLEGTKWPD